MFRVRKNKKVFSQPQIQILEAAEYKGKLGFEPLRFEKDPLLQGKNKRSLRLFKALNLSAHKIREGELWIVHTTRTEILPRVSADGRVIIKSYGNILKKQTGLAYVSCKTGELVQKVFSPDSDIDKLEKYLELPSLINI